MITQSMSFNPVPIVSIHSTILAVLIAVISAYALHIYTTIDNLETEIFQQAYRTKFVPPLPFGVSGGDNLSDEPKELLKEIESSCQSHTKYSNISAEDKSKRFCQVLTNLTHKYPFPLRAPLLQPNNEGSELDLSFDNLNKIRQWVEDIQPILNFLNWALTEGNPRKEVFQFYFDTWYNKATAIPEMSKLQVTTDQLRYFSQTISDIVQSVNIHLNKIDSYQKRMPKGKLRLHLLITCGAFLSAVIIPILLSTYLPATPIWILKVLSLWLPTVYYFILIGYLVYKLT